MGSGPCFLNGSCEFALPTPSPKCEEGTRYVWKKGPPYRKHNPFRSSCREIVYSNSLRKALINIQSGKYVLQEELPSLHPSLLPSDLKKRQISEISCEPGQTFGDPSPVPTEDGAIQSSESPRTIRQLLFDFLSVVRQIVQRALAFVAAIFSGAFIPCFRTSQSRHTEFQLSENEPLVIPLPSNVEGTLEPIALSDTDDDLSDEFEEEFF